MQCKTNYRFSQYQGPIRGRAQHLVRFCDQTRSRAECAHGHCVAHQTVWESLTLLKFYIRIKKCIKAIKSYMICGNFYVIKYNEVVFIEVVNKIWKWKCKEYSASPNSLSVGAWKKKWFSIRFKDIYVQHLGADSSLEWNKTRCFPGFRVLPADHLGSVLLAQHRYIQNLDHSRDL